MVAARFVQLVVYTLEAVNAVNTVSVVFGDVDNLLSRIAVVKLPFPSVSLCSMDSGNFSTHKFKKCWNIGAMATLLLSVRCSFDVRIQL